MAENSGPKKKIKKKGKFRKKTKKQELCNEDLNFLLEHTSFTKIEIIEWHK